MKKSPPKHAPSPRRLVGFLVFALALALRLFFWQSGADHSWPYSAHFKGDAPVWLAYAQAIQAGQPFELGLPLRPPGMGYLVAMLWDGTAAGIGWVRFVQCLLGALACWLLWAAARRSFGERVGLIVGLASAGSLGLIQLSTSINNETPYLVLVAICLRLWPALTIAGRPGRWIGWGAVNALACLFRVEHLLFLALATGLLAFRLSRIPEAFSWRGLARPFGLTAAAFVLVLLPWHLHAWGEIRRLNHEPFQFDAGTERIYSEAERALAAIPWDAAAESAISAMPAFAQRPSRIFIAGSVAVRGRRQVEVSDLQILDEAFGTQPTPIPSHPFIAVYGGLNFWLANNAEATGGFDRKPLEAPPPLTGGVHRYPGPLVRGLPPRDLALIYPPHLAALNQGYSRGFAWIAQHPTDFLKLAGHKLGLFWQGASLGISGWNLPVGSLGIRRRVDLAVPAGNKLETPWGLGLVLLCAIGLWRGRRLDSLPLWFLFLLAQIVITIAFYGYSRLGALVVPVVALLSALAFVSQPRSDEQLTGHNLRRWKRGFAAVAILLVALEGARYLAQPTIRLDGRLVGAIDPFPPLEHEDRAFEEHPSF